MAIRDNIIKLFEQVQPKTPKPRMSELASTQSELYGKYNLLPYNPDSLVARKGMQIYDQMRVDDMVKASLTLKKFATLAPNFKIIPASGDKQDVEVADFITYTLNQMEGSMNDALYQIMTALDYGFSVTEINYLQYADGKYKGKFGLKNLKTKRPHNYSFKVDRYDNLTKRGLINTIDGEERDLPVSKFLIFSYQKEFGNWYGTSDLRPAYRGWWSKDTIIKFWNIYLERFANPTVLGKYRSNDPTSRGNLRNILDNLTAKTSITHRIDEFDIEFLEPKRNSTQDFKESIGYYDRAISRSILIPDRLVAEGQFGAYSQAKVHFDVFIFVLEKLRQDLEETVVNEQLIKRLVDFNYAGVNNIPHFKFNPLTDAQRVELQEMFLNAVDRGVIVPTLEDENYIRESLFFPEKELTDNPIPTPTPPEPKPKPKPEPKEESKKKDNKDFAQLDLKPTNAMVKEAQRGLEWRKEFNRGGTQVGATRARQLTNKETLSPSTVRRMFSFFSRHLVDKKAKGFNPGEKGYPSAGRIIWALWGGDPGFSWARTKRNQLEKQGNNSDLEPFIVQALKDKSREHNKGVDNDAKKVSTRLLTLVFKRGFKEEKTDEAYERVNSFLNAVKNEKFPKEVHDTDLMPKGHKLRK